MKTMLKVVTTSALALTIGIATSIEVKASTFPSIINATIDSPCESIIDFTLLSIINDTIDSQCSLIIEPIHPKINSTIDSPGNLTIDSNNFNIQSTLFHGGDIDFLKINFNISGNFKIFSELNGISLFLFDKNKIYLPLNEFMASSFFPLVTNFGPININVNQNDIYFLGVSGGRPPILDSNNQLTGWVDSGAYTQALIPYNLNVVQNVVQNTEIPEPSTVLGLILFGFLGVAGSKKKLK